MSNRSSGGQAPPTVKLKREIEKPEIQPPVEEHLILRVENAVLAKTLKELVKTRDNPDLEKLSIRFHAPKKVHTQDARKGTLSYDNSQFSTTLVDLPCIIESQKTWDNRQLYKICDISQMLIVSDTPTLPKDTTDEYVYPHGITPPLRFVRTRRFRKRISKRAIENVEREVERLLRADAEAELIRYEHIDETNELDDGKDANGSEENAGANNGEMIGSEAGGEDELEFDDDEFAAEVEDILAEEDEEDDDDEDMIEEYEEEEQKPQISDDDGSEDEGMDLLVLISLLILLPDEIEDEEVRALREEIEELEGTIREKQQQLDDTTNPIMRTRFEGIVKRLNEELIKKQTSLTSLMNQN
ncbi:hypothetical protein HK100_005197 [Physocladia obscura]|uniref:TAFII55 protein conserved region domain-containing protein n=1 Tax=Physocladia obscura TaxID=109957 RepID=A0AAD5X9H7_9FUNG|nr:hypothetical protein HK100_005197 [Physocladia obscura]